MNPRKLLPVLVFVVLLYIGWEFAQWPGVALVVSGAVMFMLLYLNRMMDVLRRAANQPKGYVGSAVMMNAKLKRDVTLLHVIAMTRSIGEALSPEGAQPEIFRWTDDTASSVTCEFADGRLAKWSLSRPSGGEAAGEAAAP
ncbi:MAG TPA: glycerate kinase [Ramlibacter sp.]|jgi:hypothetical protein